MPQMNVRLTLPIVFAFAFPNFILPVQAQVVPGTGQQIMEVFDDFEDPNWNFTLNLPKSSANIDKTERHPSGFSANRLYLESMYRGTPDFVRRIDTPPKGLPGSKGALAMQTMQSGIPGQTSHTFQQDDLIAGVQTKLGYMMPVGWTPSYVCRVYVPPFDKWERRHGSHFGFRADCTTTITKKTSMGRIFKTFGTQKALEQYWPGFFIQLNLKEMTKEAEDYATILIRSDTLGHDVPGPKITRPGWWTLGLSLTPDGKVHYYAHEGVANLTARDHLYSNYPYDYRCEQTSTFFFNIVNQDDGHTWSTRWIVDDPKVYVATGSYRPPAPAQVAQVPQQVTQTPGVPAQPQAAPASQSPAAQPQKAVTSPQSPAGAPQTPAAQPQTPVTNAAQPVPQTGSIPAKPGAVAAVKPVSAASKTLSPAAPAIPLLASRPLDIPVLAPTLEATTENHCPTPAPVSASPSDATKPAPSSPVIDDQISPSPPSKPE